MNIDEIFPMASLASKAAYLQSSALAQFNPQRFACPNCGDRSAVVVDRKYVITQLRRCASCRLLFRTPTDDPADNQVFYENAYSQGFTTDLPSDAELANLKHTNFSGERDYTYYIKVLRMLGLAHCKLFDFGCSWGYGSHQLAQAGFNIMAFEIARNRAAYARDKLDVKIVASMDAAVTQNPGQFDCFFSAHVLEHLPSPNEAFASAVRLLRPGGLFVSFTPNGSAEHRAASRDWHSLWGQVHPNFIDDDFLDHSFAHSPRCVGSSPIVSAELPAGAGLVRVNGLENGELFFVARKVGDSW
jgi:2-polyprenyl-3-methyl-5-hydroxy-6-metoxy-1,4-benzoquinol methylase